MSVGSVVLVVVAFLLQAVDCTSQFPVVADPPVQHPPFAPTSVPLFGWTNFTGEGNVPFTYTPPPSLTVWSRVVLRVDCDCTQGHQYDRTTIISVGGHVVFIGTTAEPSPERRAPHWNVTSDLTVFSTVLRSVQTGWVQLESYTTPVYTGVLQCRASLDFYAAKPPQYKEPKLPAIAVPLQFNESLISANVTINSSSLTDVFLSLFLQGQIGDEFYWNCLPSNLSNVVGSCGKGSLRVARVSIDGVLVGTAPVFPYIFTGGVDPALWVATTASRTLNLIPLRVDLACFAGILGDGRRHLVEAAMGPTFNPWWNMAGTLFASVDPSIRSTTLEHNTLPARYAAATQTVTSDLRAAGQGSGAAGWGNVSYSLNSSCSALVTRSPNDVRRVTSTMALSFFNDQFYNQTGDFKSVASFAYNTVASGTEFHAGQSTTSVVGAVKNYTSSSSVNLRFPLKVVTNMLPYAKNFTLRTQYTFIDQTFAKKTESSGGDSTWMSDRAYSEDTMLMDPTHWQGWVLGWSGQSSRQDFVYQDSKGSCWSKTVAARNHSVYDDHTLCSRLQWDTSPLGWK